MKTVSSVNGVGRTGLVHGMKRKKETRLPSYTIHQNELKMDKKLKYKLWYHKNHRGKHSKISDILHSSIFADMWYPQKGGNHDL